MSNETKPLTYMFEVSGEDEEVMTESCEQELRGCPSCGSSAFILEEGQGATIHCGNPECSWGLIDNDWTREAAIEIWNTRTIDAEAVKRASGEVVSRFITCDPVLKDYRVNKISEIITRCLRGEK